MLKKIEMFRPYSIVKNYQDKGTVKIYWGYVGREESLAEIEDIVVESVFDEGLLRVFRVEEIRKIADIFSLDLEVGEIHSLGKEELIEEILKKIEEMRGTAKQFFDSLLSEDEANQLEGYIKNGLGFNFEVEKLKFPVESEQELLVKLGQDFSYFARHYMEPIFLPDKDGYELPFEILGLPVQYTSMDDINTVSDLFIK